MSFKRLPAVVAVFVCLLSGLTGQAQLPGTDSNWHLYWADEFDSPTLDESKWNIGYPWGSVVHNHDAYMSPNNVSIQNGNLVLTATNNGRWHDGTWYPYTSGVVNSRGHMNLDYGYVEASMKMPNHQGSWPAFWMTTYWNSWPPEIDIMEFPWDANNGSYDNTDYWWNYHYGDGWQNHQSNGAKIDTWANLTSGFHNYGVEWGPGYMHFYFDGSRVGSVTNSGAVDDSHNMQMIINYAVGGWGGSTGSSPWPSDGVDFETAWVRVWKNENVSGDVRTSTWQGDSSGYLQWDHSSNWSNGSPNLAGNRVWFRNVDQELVKVDWSGQRAISQLNFSNTNGGSINTQYQIGYENDRLMMAPDDATTHSSGMSINLYGNQDAAEHTLMSEVEIWSDPGRSTPAVLAVNNYTNKAFTFGSNILGSGTLEMNRGKVILNGNTIGHRGHTQARDNADVTVNGNITQTDWLEVDNAKMTINSFSNRYRADTSVENNGHLILNGRIYATNQDYVWQNSVNINSGGKITTESWDYSKNFGYLSENRWRFFFDDGTLELTGDTNTTRSFIIQEGGATILAAEHANVVLNPTTIENNALKSEEGGNLTLGGAGTGHFNKVLGGTGALIKTGTGSWTIGGDNTYTGETQVNQGTLILNGSIQSNTTTVSQQAHLQGTGTIHGDLYLHGTLAPTPAPGSTPGTTPGTTTPTSATTPAALNTPNTFTAESAEFFATARMVSQIHSPTQWDQLHLNQTLTIHDGAVLELIALEDGELNYYDPLILIQADGGITGQFTAIDGVVIDEITGLAVTYDEHHITAQAALLGDANLDGQVSLLDLDILGSNYNQQGTWADGDFNGDGIVSLLDLDILGSNYGQRVSIGNLVNIPAPGTTTTAATIALALTLGRPRLRRRRHA